jgi:hypothetical protein
LKLGSSQPFLFGRRVKTWCATGLALLVLVCAATADNPALHRLLHPDADDAHHECAISLFAHGQVHVASPTPMLAAPEAVVFAAPFAPPLLLLEDRDYLLLPERAPPSLLS